MSLVKVLILVRRCSRDCYMARVQGSSVEASSTMSVERAAEKAAIKEKALAGGCPLKNADDQTIENHGIKLRRAFAPGLDDRFIAEWQYQPTEPEKEAA